MVPPAAGPGVAPTTLDPFTPPLVEPFPPAPPAAVLSRMVQLVRVSVARFRIAPPSAGPPAVPLGCGPNDPSVPAAPAASPFAMVRFEIATFPPTMLNTRLALPPLIV